MIYRGWTIFSLLMTCPSSLRWLLSSSVILGLILEVFGKIMLLSCSAEEGSEMCSSLKTFLFSNQFSHVLRSDATVLLWSWEYTIYPKTCGFLYAFQVCSRWKSSLQEWTCLNPYYVCFKYIKTGHSSIFFVVTSLASGLESTEFTPRAWEPQCVRWEEGGVGSKGPSLELRLCSGLQEDDWEAQHAWTALAFTTAGRDWLRNYLGADVNLPRACAPGFLPTDQACLCG